MRMVAGLIVHARARQAAARRDEAVDAPPQPFAPADVERRELWKELQLAIGEMVVDLPRHRPPIGAVRVPVGEPVGEPRNHDRGHRADAALGVAAVSDVAPVIALVRGAAQRMRLPSALTVGAR